MVFKPNFTKVVSSTRKNIGVTQSAIELKLPTNEDVVDLVYSINAKSNIINSSVNGKEITFWGTVNFQVLYNSDGVSSMDYSLEFKDKYLSEIDLDGEMILSSKIVDVSSSVVANGVKVNAIVETNIDMISTKDTNVLTSVDGENICLSKKNLHLESYIGKAYEKFELANEFSIDNASKILSVNPSLCLKNIEIFENYLTVKGILNLDVCYLGNENNDMLSNCQNFDFTYEIAFDGLNENCLVQSQLDIVCNEIKVSSLEEENGIDLNVAIPLEYVGYVFENKEIEILEDLYSKDNYLSITSENISSIKNLNSIEFKDTVSGTASINETSPFIDDIVCVCPGNIVLANNNIENNILCLEGVATSTVIYYTKETNSITSVIVEMPFSIEQKIEGKNSTLVTLCLSSINARSKRGKEIEVSADLCGYCNVYDVDENCVISDVKLGEEKPKDDCSLYIYIVKNGDTIWSIAKDMNTTVEDILKQNPNTELPLASGDKIVIYKPQLMDF